MLLMSSYSLVLYSFPSLLCTLAHPHAIFSLSVLSLPSALSPHTCNLLLVGHLFLILVIKIPSIFTTQPQFLLLNLVSNFCLSSFYETFNSTLCCCCFCAFGSTIINVLTHSYSPHLDVKCRKILSCDWLISCLC